jgi:hypothetical protein
VAAFTISSDVNATRSTIKDLFAFLSNFENFKTILPEDKVEGFNYSQDECSFTIKGITTLTIKLVKKEPFHLLLFKSEGLSKFNFSLKVDFVGEADLPGTCKVELEGDLNPFIKAMAEKPLTGLVNTMSLKLSQLNLSQK